MNKRKRKPKRKHFTAEECPCVEIPIMQEPLIETAGSRTPPANMVPPPAPPNPSWEPMIDTEGIQSTPTMPKDMFIKVNPDLPQSVHLGEMMESVCERAIRVATEANKKENKLRQENREKFINDIFGQHRKGFTDLGDGHYIICGYAWFHWNYCGNRGIYLDKDNPINKDVWQATCHRVCRFSNLTELGEELLRLNAERARQAALDKRGVLAQLRDFFSNWVL